jgi:predicted secreted hydrolase
VWNGNWSVLWSPDSAQQLTAVTAGYRIELRLQPSKPPVIHGINGVSQKAPGAGRASHYVSLTRLTTAGRIQLRGEWFDVEGLSWMDHEFFTHSLEANQAGWDWFSLQFEDGSDLMLYRLRRKDGSVEPFSSGTYVTRGGAPKHLSVSEYSLTPSADVWVSPATQGRYPMKWTIRVPSLGIEAVTTTRLREQELKGRSGVSPSYWEGAIEVRGTRDGKPLSGSGYLEMTGYAENVRMGETSEARN